MKSTIVIAAVIAAIRVYIGIAMEPEHISFVDVYKDTAHLFIGGLAVAWWIKRLPWQWYLFWLLNALEVAMAVFSRIQ